MTAIGDVVAWGRSSLTGCTSIAPFTAKNCRSTLSSVQSVFVGEAGLNWLLFAMAMDGDGGGGESYIWPQMYLHTYNWWFRNAPKH